jgi:ornithine cyclodeaminase/alanine dehydrogenase-like protein (mu-crystallin family)
MLILDEQAVRDLLDRAAIIPAMERALADLSAGRVVQPVRVMMPIAEHGGLFGVMPAYAGAMGVKLVTLYPGNQGIPTHHAVILLFRPETGEPLVTMDGRLITEERTAAVSAVATRYLARPDASVLALIGSGAQARSHLKALSLVRQFREVRVWSPNRAAEFAREFGVIASASAEEAVRGADVVVTAAMVHEPVLHGEWLSAGAHVNAVSWAREFRELDDEVLRRARLYVDSRAACASESADAQAAGEIVAELGEVISGTAPGRGSPDEITVFKSVGLAIEDVVTADLVYQAALRKSPPGPSS